MTLETAVGGESLLGRAKTNLRLRLAGHDGQTRVIAVEPAKCLVGAAPSCTLRLDDNCQDDRRLDPFHCLIVRGATHTVVRRISPAMRLNGRDFSDAVLNPGDRLAIGSYVMEVLAPECDEPASQAAGEVQAVRAEADRLNRMLVAERAAWQARNDELTAELARTKAEAARRAADFDDDAARHAHTEQELSRVTADLQRATTVLREERNRWQAERQDDQAMLEEAQQALQRQQATWQQTVARFEQEQRAWHAERQLKTTELSGASKRIAHLEAELARSRDRAARLADEASAGGVRVGEAREAVKRLQKDLACAQSQLDEERRERQAELGQKAVELAGALERAVHLEAELSTANERLARLSEDAEAQATLYESTQDALERSEDEQARALAAFDQERTAWQTERAVRTAELNEKSQDLADAVGRLSRLEAELSDANEQISRLTDDVDSQAALYTHRQEALERLEKELAEVQEAFDRERFAWQTERDVRAAELNDKSQEFAAAAERLSLLNAELSQAKDEISRLTEDATAQTALYGRTQEALEADLALANEQIVRLTEEAKAHAAQYDSAQQALQRFKTEREETHATFDQERTAWQTERDLRMAELNERTQELAAATERLSQIDGELSHANAQIARLTEEVHSQTALHDRAQKSVQQLEEELEETQAVFDEERTSWQTEREARSAELSEKSLELAAAEERLSRLDAELSQANNKIARLTDDLDAQGADHGPTEDALARLQRLHEERAEMQAAFDQARTEWQREQSQHSLELAAAVERVTRLEAELETANSQIAGLAKDADNQAGDEERQAALERLGAELEALRQTLDEERQAWFTERSELHADVAQAASQNAAFERYVAELTDELEAARRDLAEQRADWEQRQVSDHAVGQPSVEVDVPVLDETPTDLEPTNGEPSNPSDREPVDGGPVSCEPIVNEPVVREPVHNEPVEKQPTRTEDLFAHFAAPETAEIAFQTPPSDAPVSTVDLLSRFGLSVHQETPDTAPLSPHRTEVTPQPAAETGPVKPAHADGHHDEQDTIDAYMAQLMARLGKSGYVPPQDVAPQPPQISNTAPEPEVAAPPAPPRQAPKLRDPSEMGRRALPPELATDLSAMRELANLNARAAIDTHARSTLVKAWLSKALVMVLGMVTAGVETWFAMEGNEWAGYFIVPCLMIGIFWGWQYLVMSKRLHSSRDVAAEPSGDVTAATAEPGGDVSRAQEATEEVDA
jgi:chromosome segregation ATPase